MSGNISYTLLPSVSLGSMIIDSLEAIVLPGNNPSLRAIGRVGIIGEHALNLVVTFDAQSKAITLSRSSFDESDGFDPDRNYGMDSLLLALNCVERKSYTMFRGYLIVEVVWGFCLLSAGA